jgi:hypothetical protein
MFELCNSAGRAEAIPRKYPSIQFQASSTLACVSSILYLYTGNPAQTNSTLLSSSISIGSPIVLYTAFNARISSLEMVETKPKVLVVVAAGPLIGVGVAALFAEKGFTHIALLSRNAERLQQDAKDGGLPVGANTKGIIVKTYAADVTVPESLNSALRKIEVDFGAPEVVVYNGARVSLASLSKWDSWTEEDMVTDFRVQDNSQKNIYT